MKQTRLCELFWGLLTLFWESDKMAIQIDFTPDVRRWRASICKSNTKNFNAARLAKIEAKASIETSHTGVWGGASGAFNENIGQTRRARTA